MAKIAKLGIATLNEDQFLDLIATRKGAKLDEKAIKAKEKEDQKIKDAAKEMEKREKEEEQLRKRKAKAMEGTGVAVKSVSFCFCIVRKRLTNTIAGKLYPLLANYGPQNTPLPI